MRMKKMTLGEIKVCSFVTLVDHKDTRGCGTLVTQCTDATELKADCPTDDTSDKLLMTQACKDSVYICNW